MKTIFVTERPTQLITALAVCKNLNLHDDVLLIVANCFENAQMIVNRFSESEPHLQFRMVESYDDAMEVAKSELPAHLFIHWDVGFGTQRRLKRLTKINRGGRISVFEEGVGTYRQDIYPHLKRLVFRFMGLPINVGGSRYTSDIYVFDKEKYIENATVRPHNIIQISPNLDDFILERKSQLLSIFSGEGMVESFYACDRNLCEIYLSNWQFQESDLNAIFSNRGAQVIKLHPHCKVRVLRKDMILAPQSMPAELLILIASRMFDFVVVYHTNSSVPQYIDCRNVEFTNLYRVK